MLRWAIAITLVAACGRIGFQHGADARHGDAALSAIAQRAYIKASNGASFDTFGDALALSADGSTLVVGADTAAGTGAVYVFGRVAGAWEEQAYIRPSMLEAFDRFGYRVAVSADGTTLAVGAIGEDSAATGVDGNEADNTAMDAGAAYVFVREGGTWLQQAYLKGSNTAAGHELSRSIALSADGATLAVGAHGENSGAGAVYVFTRTGNTWTQEASVRASNTEPGDGFGLGITLSADGSTLAVGAPGEDSAATGISGSESDDSAPDAGAVYVFARSSAWAQRAYIKAFNTTAGDTFQFPDLSADGTTLLVGAPAEDSGRVGDPADESAMNAGAAYVFRLDERGWFQEAYLKPSNPGAGDRFGVSGTLSADGATIVIGAPEEDSAARGIGGDEGDNSALNAGACYVFVRTGTTWSQRAYVKASNTDAGDEFANVALSSDASTLAVAARLEDSAATGIDSNQDDNSASDTGAIYIFE